MNKTMIGGIITLIIILSSGTTYYIQSLNEKTGCRAGWEYHNETHYKCITKSGERYEMCFEVYNSANTKNYWCEKGKSIKIEDDVKIQLSREYICPKRPGQCMIDE